LSEEPQGTPSLLLVDDDPITRILVRNALEPFAFERVIEAVDGVEAQAVLEKYPDIPLVITDIIMPRLDGLGLLRWAQARGTNAVWIILSGLDSFDNAVEAIRLGAFDFLAKPPQPALLEVSVRNALEQRRLRAEQTRLYKELEDANHVLQKQVRELEDKSELLRRDLERAEVIQRALLPNVPPPIDRYCVQTVYRPGRYVGGDLYDVVRLGTGHIGFYVADATGHGVTAAMLSVLFKQQLALTDAKGQPIAPAAVLEAANRAFCGAHVGPGLFLTAVYCLLDAVAGTVTIASAGHPPALHVSAGGETQLIRRTGPALGVNANATYREVTVSLGTDDRLVLYSDGVLQAFGGPDPEQLRALLHIEPSGGDQESEFAELVGRLQTSGVDDEDPDDVTLMLLEMRAGTSHFDNGASAVSAPLSRAVHATQNAVFYGETDNASWLAVRGRVTWQHCDVLHDAAVALLETKRRVMIDLAACEYMDSTTLGLIHELVELGGVRLRGVKPALHDLFDELDMEKVLAAVDESTGDPPEYHPVDAGTRRSDGRVQMLRAHETLSALSPQNEEQFRGVVEALRKDLTT